jgi:uncharacterized OB-fold protein
MGGVPVSGDRLAALAAERVEAGLCPECGHRHMPDPEGCVGDPTPSDLWAGVSVEACDCDY